MIAAVSIDWSLRATDIVMIVAVFLGPFLAVRVTEGLRLKKEKRDRQIHVFRTLMATRASSLSPTHVEALNLIDIEFDHRGAAKKRVVAAWKLYHAHLCDHSYPPESWNHRRAELLVDLLHEMAECLGYDFDKAHIKSSSYYPKGYGEIEEDQHQIRKKIRELIEGRSAIHVISHMSADQFDRLTGVARKEGEPAGTSNAGSRPSSGDSPASETPSSAGPRG